MSLIDLRRVDPLPVPVEVLRIIDERARQLDVRVLVIGAAARDLVVHAVNASRSRRATLDVDVAVAVDRPGFESFTRPWERIEGNEHKFEILGFEVDIVPFGPVETDRHVVLNENHVLDVNGLSEAARTAVSVQLDDDLRIEVASLPAQAALKVLAWRDRHMENPKDAQDLREILSAMAEDPHAEEVWDDIAALEWADDDINLAAAYRVGSLASEPFAVEHGRAVLVVVEDPELRGRLARQMGSLMADELLGAFVAGFRGGLHPA